MSDLFENVRLSLKDPRFPARAFSLVSKLRKSLVLKASNQPLVILSEEYDELSRRNDRTGVQSSIAIRNNLRARRLANLLINEKGEISEFLIPRLIESAQQHLYSLGPDRQYDAKRQAQILSVLIHLKDNKEVIRLLKSIGRPFSNPLADQVIRDTLVLPASIYITDAFAKRAALSALFCLLRQSVGSCFATAPAILIHDVHPEQFLKDVVDLFGRGAMTRVAGGHEYAVPMSPSFGAGDLKRPLLLDLSIPFEKGAIWSAPGMVAGFEAAGLVDPKLPLKDRLQRLQEMITSVFDAQDHLKTPFFITVQDIFKRAILKNMGLTVQELTEFENRPQPLMQEMALMQLAGGASGKAKLFALFEEKFLAAKSTFKAMADNALLKTWEFTLASFAETKANFTRWNLYASLGLKFQDHGGIGPCVYQFLQEKIEIEKQKVHGIQGDYETAYSHLQYLEARLRNASSEKEAHWMKSEYQAKLNEFHTLEAMKEDCQRRANQFSQLFELQFDHYDKLFPQYFQEVYDADMHTMEGALYDDSPAGFRLVYKHGRSRSTNWSPINTPQEFIDALASFFTHTEKELSSLPFVGGIEQEFSEMITAVVTHIRTPEFLETAFYRMAEAHGGPKIKNPLENLEKIEKKPWMYTSGGSITTLLSGYFAREQPPTEVERWVEKPIELLVFLADTLRQMPYKMTDQYLADPKKGLLIHSPTHAFILRPGMSPFKESWKNDAFTYTWIRDHLVIPAEQFIAKITLTQQMYPYLIDRIAEKVAINFRHYFKEVFAYIPGEMAPFEFRGYIADLVSRERGLRYGSPDVLSMDEIDSLLFAELPLFPTNELEGRALQILSTLPGISQEMLTKIDQGLNQLPSGAGLEPWMGAKALQDVVKGLICLASSETSTSYDYPDLIAQEAKKRGFALPMPVIFADTNWVSDEFGFTVNPGTGSLGLWRVDYTGTVGTPISVWDLWLNGSRKDRTWGVFSKPQEYTL